MEGRTLGKIDLKEETSNGIIRITVKDGYKIGKNKMVIGEGPKEGVSESDASLQ